VSTSFLVSTHIVRGYAGRFGQNPGFRDNSRGVAREEERVMDRGHRVRKEISPGATSFAREPIAAAGCTVQIIRGAVGYSIKVSEYQRSNASRTKVISRRSLSRAR